MFFYFIFLCSTDFNNFSFNHNIFLSCFLRFLFDYNIVICLYIIYTTFIIIIFIWKSIILWILWIWWKFLQLFFFLFFLNVVIPNSVLNLLLSTRFLAKNMRTKMSLDLLMTAIALFFLNIMLVFLRWILILNLLLDTI